MASELEVGGVKVEGTAGANVSIISGATSHGSVFFGDAGDAEDGVLGYDQNVRKMYIRTAGDSTKRFSVDSTGLVTCANGIAVTTGGVKFPATQSASADANTLDDYEEGTWTPTWTGATASDATYTRIGRVVYASGKLTATGAGTSGDCGGLPFASGIDGADGGGSGYHGDDALTWSVLKTSASSFRFYTGSTQKQLTSSYGIRFFITYHV